MVMVTKKGNTSMDKPGDNSARRSFMDHGHPINDGDEGENSCGAGNYVEFYIKDVIMGHYLQPIALLVMVMKMVDAWGWQPTIAAVGGSSANVSKQGHSSALSWEVRQHHVLNPRLRMNNSHLFEQTTMHTAKTAEKLP